MESINLYTRRFSEIGFGIQTSKIVYYNLCFNGIYGIQVIVETSKFKEQDTVYISKDEDLVREVAKYLYENAVDISLFRDVVDDVLVSIGYKKIIL